MSTSEEGRRVLAPGDPIADEWMTRTDCKRVLVIAPHLQAATRLACDVLPHLESDLRLQAIWSVPDTGYRWARVESFVDGLGGLVVPWRQALETRHDLVLAACFWGLAEANGPKMLLSHGINGIRSRIGPHSGPIPHDMHPGKLMQNGEVVPNAIMLAHEDELTELARRCPQALPHAVVAGDPCLDRMTVSRPLRRLYRRALGVRKGQKLVVVTTTWGPHSLVGSTHGTIFQRVVAQLPADEYRVVAVAHPFFWDGHSRRTVTSWLARAQAAGLVVLPPEEGWRAALVAADVVIGDHGSVAQYAAALGTPVLMSTAASADVRPGSTAAVLAATTPPFDADASIEAQVSRALATPPLTDFAQVVTSRPGRSAAILVQHSYRLLGIPAPAEPVEVFPVPPPVPLAPAHPMWTVPSV